MVRWFCGACEGVVCAKVVLILCDVRNGRGVNGIVVEGVGGSTDP